MARSSSSAVTVSMLLLLMFLAAVNGVAGGGGLLDIPSTASLAHCPSRCGNISIPYPFGIGPGCFRQGFELTCDDTAHPPRLFLGNSTTQITRTFDNQRGIEASAIGFNITLMPGVDSYYRSWEVPVKGAFLEGNDFYVVGCNVDVYIFSYNTTDLVGSCTSTCVRETMDNSNVEGYCLGNNGCCHISLPWEVLLQAFRFKLVRHDGALAEPDEPLPNVKVIVSQDYDFHTNDVYSSWVNSSNLQVVWLGILIMDQPNCETAQRNKDSYACSDESTCTNLPSGQGYYCSCYSRMGGNPYIRDGCIVYNQPKRIVPDHAEIWQFHSLLVLRKDVSQRRTFS